MTNTPPVTPPASPPPPAADAAVDSARTFTQDELNRHAGRARDEARRAAVTEVAEQLGCTVEEAQQRLQAAADAEAATLTEVERRERAAADALAAAEAREATAAERERQAGLRDRLRDADVPAERLDRALRSLALTPESTEDEIAAEVTEAAGIFGTPTTDDGAGATPPPPPGIPPARPPATKGGTGETDYERGARLVREGTFPRIA